MTVLTFPPVGGKSDKTPLIDDAEDRQDQSQPPPPLYHPKFLETGDGGVLNTNNNDNGTEIPVKTCMHRCPEYKRSMHKMFRITIALLMVLVILYFTIDTLCKSYVQDLHQKQHDTEDDATVPCKSYSSYADAENDMLTLSTLQLSSLEIPSFEMPSSSPEPNVKNLVISLVINPAEAAITKEPQIIINKSARFLHDFSVNITGIIDLESQRCYVMPLLRNSVEPPESLYDMLIKMSSGYYSLDINKILSNFRMVKPAISDLSDYGLYISKDCADYPTFKLEKDIVTESP